MFIFIVEEFTILDIENKYVSVSQHMATLLGGFAWFELRFI